MHGKSHAILQLFFLLPFGAAAGEQTYEGPADLNAADFLSAEILLGDHHRVDDRVRNDGYLNYYTIQSDYGEFEAVSTAMLRIRVGEINALAELEALSKTEVFVKAAADAGKSQLLALHQFATHPVETAKGIPKGIGNMFRRFGRQTSEAVDVAQDLVVSDSQKLEDADSEEEGGSNMAVDLTASYFGVNKAQRAWSHKLGTDPYSSNKVLQAVIKEVAWAERLGRVGMGFAGVPSIPGTDIISDVNEIVWSKDPYELRDLNRARLVATGADEMLIEKFLGNPRLTPSQQTLLTAAIAELEGVEGRAEILRLSLNAQTGPEMHFFIQSLTILAWYHRNQSPIASVETGNAIPIAILDSGTTVLVFAADYVYWTETIARVADKLLSAGEHGAAHEIWLLGTLSERSKVELTELGYDVHVDVAQLLAEHPAAE